MNVKLADFGSSMPIVDTNDTVSEVKGTSYFMAPEAIRFASASFSGRKYDVWSLGVTLFCMTFNRLPFTFAGGKRGDQTQAATLEAIKSFSPQFNVIEEQVGAAAENVEVEVRDGQRFVSQGLATFLGKMLQRE